MSLSNFYTKFLPMFEMKVAPLHQLYTKFLHKSIPINEWTPDLQRLFKSLKKYLTSDPLISRYDSFKPIFSKTDWSSLGMSFIVMQPGNDKVSAKTTKNYWIVV